MEIVVEDQHLKGGPGDSAEIWQTETIMIYSAKADMTDDVKSMEVTFQIEGKTLTAHSLYVEPVSRGTTVLTTSQTGDISSSYQVDDDS